MKDEDDTGQGLSRTETENHETENKAPAVATQLSPELCAKFRAQLTPELTDHITPYAVKRANMVADATGLHDPSYAEDLLQAAITDTLAGIVTWDGTISLALHLRQVIRSRTSHELERAEDRQLVSISKMHETELSEALEMDVVPTSTPDVVALVAKFVAELRTLAEGDEPVLALLDCYADGLSERRQICRETKMTSSTYHNARRRLLRLVEKLPRNLIDAVKAEWS